MEMTDETAKELADAMRKLAEAINNLRGGGAQPFTVYHQHQGSPYQQMPYPPHFLGGAGFS